HLAAVGGHRVREPTFGAGPANARVVGGRRRRAGPHAVVRRLFPCLASGGVHEVGPRREGKPRTVRGRSPRAEVQVTLATPGVVCGEETSAPWAGPCAHSIRSFSVMRA